MTTSDLSTLFQQPIPQDRLKSLLLEVHNKLESKTPGLQIAMGELHKHLLAHGELTHILDDDDIQLLVHAHEEFKQIRIVQVAEKASKKASTKLGKEAIKNIKDDEF